MLLIIVILLVDMIVVPLVDLCLNERVRIPVKVAVYGLTLLFVLYELIVAKPL